MHAVLQSPLRRLLSRSVCEIEYLGRRSGRLIRLPVQYARDGDRIVVVAGAAGTKRWWRNFAGASRAVTVDIAGEHHGGWARVVGSGEPAYERALAVYRKRFDAVPEGGFQLVTIDLVRAWQGIRH